jgi:hypothetical protein
MTNSNGPNRTPQADHPVTPVHINWRKLLLLGWERSSILQDSVKFVMHTKSAMKQNLLVNSVILLHKGSYFEKFHSVKNYQTLYKQLS